MGGAMLAITAAMLLQAAPVAGGAAASVASPQTINATSPQWERSPGPDDYLRYHPEAARKAFLNGRAVLLCHVASDGALDGCRAEDVSPTDAGFAEAALRMETLFKLPPPMRDGQPVDGGWLRVPLTFRMSPDIQTAAVAVKSPEVTGVSVYVECRYQQAGLDDCSVDGATGRAKDLALEAATLLKLPPLPRPRGRMAVTLTFAGDPPPPADKSVIIAPYWLRLPSGQDIARVFPDRAQRQEVQGLATVLCHVSSEGTLVNCEVTAEAPGGAGFGAAAMKLTPLFKMKPQTRDGTPVIGGTVRIPMRFNLPKG